MPTKESVPPCALARFCGSLRKYIALHAASISPLLACLGCLLAATNPALAQQPAATDKQAKIAAIQAEMKDAVQKVRTIINQPVTRVIRTKNMDVSIYSPGWFHDGASKPDFNSVDVRQTQDLIYANKQYVTSDLNPGVVFLGSQLEFNSMTKYFYTDRSLPKKKLTEQQMLAVNSLYRIIGRCEQQLEELERPPGTHAPAKAQAESEEDETEPAQKYEPVPTENYIKAAIGVSIVLVVYFIYRKFR